MNAIAKRIALGMALFITLITAWFAPSKDSDAVAMPERKISTAKKIKEITPNSVLQQDKPVSSIEILDVRSRMNDVNFNVQLFSKHSWIPTQKKIPESSIVNNKNKEAPLAPPLPFRFLGRYEEDGKTVFFLLYNDQNLVVRVGDIIDDQYKIENIVDSTLNVRYLPLNQTQMLDVGGSLK